MGNAWFGKKTSSEGMVHPHPVDQGVRLKVRMASGQLKELMGKVDMSKGGSELGRLILQECFEGRLQARVVVAAEKGSESAFEYVRGSSWGLTPIHEHSD